MLSRPLYLAISAASQIVINDHDSHSKAWFDQHGLEPLENPAVVNPSALNLVNHFLDQLLFNFLATSKSTSLASLRPAVVETLKPKLAREAIDQADQELEEYLGRGDDEELTSFHNGIEPSGDWNLELVWKRTRLRCMVYSSLGDMDDEDEDHYTELEHLHPTSIHSNLFEVVSPAAAIFLTSILEFMGEQALTVAGRAAYNRMHSKQQKDERDKSSVPKSVADRVIVEDVDMERVALDRTLGRLWRGWKKRLRLNSPSVDVAGVAATTHPTRHSRASQKGDNKTDPTEFTKGPQIMASSRVPVGGVLTLKGHCAGVRSIPKTPSASPTIKAACPLSSQVSSDSDIGETVPKVIEPESVALGIDAATHKPDPVPVRSPLRGAVALGSCSKSSRIVPTIEASVQPTWTNQVGSADTDTLFARPLASFRKITKNASDTSNEASTIALRYFDTSVSKSEPPLGSYSSKNDAHLHPALRSAPPPRSAAHVRLNAPVGRDASEFSSGFAEFIRPIGPSQIRDDSGQRVRSPYVPILVDKSLAATGTSNHLQVRDAVVYSDNLSSSELIDFIRQGPPSEPFTFDCVKDSYAINYSDDEEDDNEFALPKDPPKRAGESLIDFLNSGPPTDTSKNSIINKLSAILPKKTIMARFSRSNSAESSYSALTRRSVLARSSSLLHNPSASLTRHNPISSGQFA